MQIGATFFKCEISTLSLFSKEACAFDVLNKVNSPLNPSEPRARHNFAHFSKILPNINRGIILEKFDHYRKTFSSSVERIVTEFQMQKNGISFVSLKYTNLTKDFYVFNNGKNRKVLTWTIKSELDAEKIRNFCDNITFEGFKPI